MNPYAQVDMRARIWICPFCLQRNGLPPHYKDISAEAVPPELVSVELGPMSALENYHLIDE
jgi:hypothetical protein